MKCWDKHAGNDGEEEEAKGRRVELLQGVSTTGGNGIVLCWLRQNRPAQPTPPVLAGPGKAVGHAEVANAHAAQRVGRNDGRRRVFNVCRSSARSGSGRYRRKHGHLHHQIGSPNAAPCSHHRAHGTHTGIWVF